MLKNLKKILSSDGSISSKRVISVGAFLLLALGFLCNLFFKLTIDKSMYDTMSYIVVAGLGFTASELFSGGKKDVDPDDEEDVK